MNKEELELEINYEHFEYAVLSYLSTLGFLNGFNRVTGTKIPLKREKNGMIKIQIYAEPEQKDEEEEELEKEYDA